MRPYALLILPFATALSFATTLDPSGLWKPFAATYKLHSGMAADRTPPTATERLLTISIEGKPAKDLFESLGPDLKTSCSGDEGDRERSRKGISCVYTAQDKASKDGPYRCWIGLNLKTGDTEPTVAC